MVVQSGSSADTGSALYHDINSQRWAVAKGVASDAAAVTPTSYVTTVTTANHNPNTDSGSYGDGEMWINTSDEEIWVVVENQVPGATQWNPITGELILSWQEPGIQIVNVTAEDRHGFSSNSIITVNVVDDLPLIWKHGSSGDFTISVDTTDYFTNPSVTITNVGVLELSEISVFWGICNSVTGICHTSGISHNLGPFIVNHISGDGLGVGDYMTFTVRAVDQNGMDRVTDETYKIHATLPEIVIEEETSGDEKSSSITFSPLMVTGILIFVILSMLILSLSTVAILRRKYKLALESQYESHAPIELMDRKPSKNVSRSLPPPPPMVPKLPESGLPEGWSMEQWHYYGEEYIRRQK